MAVLSHGVLSLYLTRSPHMSDNEVHIVIIDSGDDSSRIRAFHETALHASIESSYPISS